ncbi:MAG: hypothetical protein ACPIOQ_63015 [Promethearchaeia archaeon]
MGRERCASKARMNLTSALSQAWGGVHQTFGIITGQCSSLVDIDESRAVDDQAPAGTGIIVEERAGALRVCDMSPGATRSGVS